MTHKKNILKIYITQNLKGRTFIEVFFFEIKIKLVERNVSKLTNNIELMRNI